ncbi:hypothetical protein ACZ91_07030 [Streptomyces regensis]|nr:hypothetical protein ACZ91_07030 [Streptomyces regensis]
MLQFAILLYCQQCAETGGRPGGGSTVRRYAMRKFLGNLAVVACGHLVAYAIITAIAPVIAHLFT